MISTFLKPGGHLALYAFIFANEVFNDEGIERIGIADELDGVQQGRKPIRELMKVLQNGKTQAQSETTSTLDEKSSMYWPSLTRDMVHIQWPRLSWINAQGLLI